MVRKFIPWAEPRYWGEEIALANEALHSTWISGGPFVDRLERELSGYLSSPHVVATSNGTTAIHAAYLALDVKPGDEIVVPAFAFMAAANVAIHLGARPIFADVDPNTWCITAETVEPLLNERTKGIVPVHTYGNVCDMQPLLDLAASRGSWVLEDAAEAFGSTYRGRQAGTVAPIGTYSFHATKTITTGEGGAVATRDAALQKKMALQRSHGMSTRRYWHDVAGHNFRLTNVQAAIGCAQLQQIESISRARSRVLQRYTAELANVPGVELQQITPGVDPIIWAVAVRLDPKAFRSGRDDVMARLAEAGIETRPGFYAASEMPHLYVAPRTDRATELGRQVISLPSSPTVTDDEIAHIVAALKSLAH